ncbi:MAG: LapA family protein [Acidobacteria bacterium]|nr:LapA family protein [Acidobacteriota bacterium]
MKVLVVLIITSLFFVALLFCVQNLDQEITVTFWPYVSPPLPVYVVTGLAVLLGVAATGLVALIEGVKLNVRNLKLSRQVKKLETELDSLRGLALGSGAPEAEDEPTQAAPGDEGDEPRIPTA